MSQIIQSGHSDRVDQLAAGGLVGVHDLTSADVGMALTLLLALIATVLVAGAITDVRRAVTQG